MAIDIDLSEDRQFRVAGEDAPLWPAIAFAVLGAALAFAASAQILTPPASPPAQIAAPPSDRRPQPAAPAAPVPDPATVAPEAALVAPPAAKDASANLTTPPADLTEPATEAAKPAPESSAASAQPQAAATPAPIPTPAPAPVAAAEPAVCLPIISIPFDLDSARLKTTGLDALVTPLRAWLAAHKDAVLSVEGHADATGPEAYNVVLSYKRAEAAAVWLAQAGVGQEQIATRAAGTRAPSRRAAIAVSNRQVILQIEGVEACRDDGAPAQNP